MFELSITWWKAKDDPDPDQTPEWTSVIPGTHAATQRNTVARLQRLFRCAEDFSRSHRWGPSTRGAVPGSVYLPGNIEKGTPAQYDFAPANRPFPSAHDDIIPAMRVRYVASYDFAFEYGKYAWKTRMDEAILKWFSQPDYPGAEGYVPAEEFLARRLIGASVLWRDAHHVWFCLPCIAGDDEVEKLEYEPQLELWPARTPFEKSFVYAELEKKLGEHLPGWYLRKTVIG